jgi:hypothetical protein
MKEQEEDLTPRWVKCPSKDAGAASTVARTSTDSRKVFDAQRDLLFLQGQL